MWCDHFSFFFLIPSRTSERGGEGYCVKGGGGEEGERAVKVDYATALDIEVDP